jgi:hypothetical protein
MIATCSAVFSLALSVFVAWPQLKARGFHNLLIWVLVGSLTVFLTSTVFNALPGDSLPANLSAGLKDLPSNSRTQLMLLTEQNNQEAWGESDAAVARKAAGPLKDHDYAIDLKQDELDSIATHRKLSYGLRLTDKGIKLHDQMVKVLGDMLGTAEATAWIKEHRREPGSPTCPCPQ